jgi:hypothetical protein
MGQHVIGRHSAVGDGFSPTNQNLSQNHSMDTSTLDPRVSVFGSVAEESAYNAWLSAELDKRAADKRPGVPHDQVGANLAELLSQLRKKAA